MSEREITHEADATGTRCARCGAALVAPGSAFRYPTAAHATVMADDPGGSWRTWRPVSCGREARR